MSKTALLFAGQGAQTVGMGKDLAERFPAAKCWFERADAVLGYELSRICFAGPEDVLTRTEHAQPGIFLVGWIAFELLRERLPGLRFEATAGLSLGEFTALAVAGALDFEDGLRLVRQRGCFMQEACADGRGTMAAVLGLDEARLREVCEVTGVVMANLNCPGQIVLSGETERVMQAIELARERGARRAVPLPVAGAYHSPLMATAQAKFRDAIATVPVRPPVVPVIANVTARPHGGPEAIRACLVEQVTAPVRWEASMRYLLAEGFTQFIELGPGTALTGFMKRICPEARMLRVGDVASLEATVSALAAAP